MKNKLFSDFFLLLFSSFCFLMHQRGKDIVVEIHTQTKADSDQLFWQRQFKFPGRTRRFISRMQYLQDNEIIESVGWGLSIRLKLSVDKASLGFS